MIRKTYCDTLNALLRIGKRLELVTSEKLFSLSDNVKYCSQL